MAETLAPVPDEEPKKLLSDPPSQPEENVDEAVPENPSQTPEASDQKDTPRVTAPAVPATKAPAESAAPVAAQNGGEDWESAPEQNAELEATQEEEDTAVAAEEDPELGDAAKSEDRKSIEPEPEAKQSEAAQADVSSESIKTDRIHLNVKTDAPDSTVFTVAEVKGGIWVGGRRKSEESEDPTNQFDPFHQDVGFFRYSHLLDHWLRVLLRERIIVLTCPDEKIALTAACALFQLPDLARRRHRQLVLSRFKDRWKEDPYLDLFAVRNIGGKEETVILIDVDSKHFLDTMFVQRLAHKGQIHTVLREQKNSLVCLISEAKVYESFAQRRSEFKYAADQIPFLRMLLESAFSEEKAERLAAQIAAQYQKGLWGKSTTHRSSRGTRSRRLSDFDPVAERRFYRAIRTHLQEKNLEAEVRRLQQGGTCEKTVEAADLFAEASEIGKAVLFVAAFFQDLSPDEFEHVLAVLLRDDMTEVKVESEIVTAKGKIKTAKVRKEKPLMQIWTEDADSILAAAHLKTYQSQRKFETIDFSHPYLREDLIAYLRQNRPIYLRHRFERIQESGLLFEPGASRNQVQQTISLCVDMALTDPTRHGQKWLTAVILSSLREIRPPAREPEQQFLEVLRQISDRHIQGHIFSRLADLFREMLEHDQLRSVIHQCPETLLQLGRHEEALQLILEITRRLRFAPEFDAVRLIRRLIDGPPRVSRAAYSVLRKQARQMGVRLYDLLGQIHEWLPDTNTVPPLTRSQLGSLNLIWDLCWDTVQSFAWENLGKWPSRYPLFLPLDAANGQTQRRVEMIVSWVLHPLTTEAISIEGGDSETGIWFLRADLLEAWYGILLGGDSLERVEAAVELIDSLLLEVISRTTPEDHAKLLGRWRSRRKLYFAEIARFNLLERETRARLRAMIRLCLELEQRFLQLKRSSTKQRTGSMK